MDNTLIYTFARFAGFNDIEKEFRLPSSHDPQGAILNDVASLENVDIDNSMAVSTRPGSVSKLSGTSIHSLWASGSVCLYVDSGILKQIKQDYTSLTIGQVGIGRMSYAPVNDRVYLTNTELIGYFKSPSLTALVDPAMNYKLPLPPGKFITYYRGRIYVAKGSILYVSDPLTDYYDIRSGFKPFSGDITMLIPVDNGLYVSDGNTWFLEGKEPDEFIRTKVHDVDAIPYTAQPINGAFVKDGEQGNFAMWVSASGICLGDRNGNVQDVTNARYNMTAHGIGGAAVRNKNGVVHYITTLE